MYAAVRMASAVHNAHTGLKHGGREYRGALGSCFGSGLGCSLAPRLLCDGLVVRVLAVSLWLGLACISMHSFWVQVIT